MAAILVVEGNGRVAAHLARTLRDAGHTPILAPDCRAALQELARCPDLVLLDLELPDFSGEVALRHLKGRPETAKIPVLILTGQRQAAARLRDLKMGGLLAILLKPVSGPQLRQAVASALAGHQAPGPDALRELRERQRALIFRLIVEGSDALALHVSHRLSVDRPGLKSRVAAETLTWAEIATWGTREGLLDPEEARLLRSVPLAEPWRARAGSA